MSKAVLIVDDESEMLDVLRKALEHYSKVFSVLVAGDGEAALEILRENDIALVVTDLIMPKMDGFSLLVHIRSDFPGIPVIIMTGHRHPVMERMAWKIGVADYIEKPFKFEELAQRIIANLGEEGRGKDGGLRKIKVPFFLRLIDLEKMTCRVSLLERSSRREGIMFFRDGRLVDARLEDLPPEKAVYEMLGWNDVDISTEKGGSPADMGLSMSLQDILDKTG
ncbi:MAG: response regulator [Thermodesulfobacteriota bacterium]